MHCLSDIDFLMQTTMLKALRHHVHVLKTVKNLHSEFSRLPRPSFLFKYVTFSLFCRMFIDF